MENPVFNKSASEEVLHSLFSEKKKNKELTLEIQELEETIEKLINKQRNDPNDYSHNQLEEKFIQLQESYNNLKRQYQSILHDFNESQEESKALRGQQKILKELIEKLTQDQSSKKEEVANLKHDLESTKNQLAKLDELSDVIKLKDLQNVELQKAISDSKIFREETSQHAQQLERVIQFLREKNEEFQLEKKQLQKEYQASQDNIATINSEMELINEKLKLQEANLEEEKARHRKAIKEFNLVKDQYKDLLVTLEANTEIIEKREIEFESIKQELHFLQNENASLKTDISNATEAFEERGIAFEKIKQELISSRDENFVLNENLRKASKLDSELRIALEKIEISKENNNALERDKNKLEEKISNLENEVKSLEEKLNFANKSKEDETLELRSQAESLEAEKLAAIEITEKQKRSIDDLKSSIAARESSYIKESSQMIEKIENAENKHKKLQSELDEVHNRLKIVLEEKEKAIFQLNSEKQSLLSKVNNNQNEQNHVNEIKKQYEEILSEKNALQEQLIALKKHLLEKEKTNSDHEKSQKTIQDLKASLLARETAYQSEIVAFREKTLGFKTENHELRQQLKNLQESTKGSRELLDEVTIQKDRIEEMYNSLRSEFEKTQEIIESLRKEKKQLKIQYLENDLSFKKFTFQVKDLQTQLDEKEHLLNKVQQEYSQSCDQVIKLRELLEIEKERARKESQKSEEIIKKHDDTKKILEDLSRESLQKEKQINTIQEELRNKELQKDEAEKELTQSKKKIEEIHLESEKIKAENNRLLNQVEKSLSHIEELQSYKEDLYHKYSETQEELTNLTQKIYVSSQSQLNAEKKYEDLLILLKQKELFLEENKKDLLSLQHEKQNLESEIGQIKKRSEESESRAQLAQQHLAKKVKETTSLSEEIEKKNRKNLELQHTLGLIQNQMNELKRNSELNSEEKFRLENKLQEVLTKTEHEVRNWENKYQELYKQWQQTDYENHELIKQKEKLDRLQDLLTNFSHVMGNPFNESTFSLASPQTIETIKETESYYKETPIKINSQQNEMTSPPLVESTEQMPFNSSIELNNSEPIQNERKEKDKEYPYENLFDLGNQLKSKYKGNLFD